MVSMFIPNELAVKEYEKDTQRLINILRNSDSKFKDTPEDKIHFAYSLSFFKNKGEYTPEYYENLYQMKFDERYEEEVKKARVSLSMTAGYFYISDRVDGVSESVKNALKMITAQKMINEQARITEKTGEENEEVLKSIPIPKEEQKPMTLQEQLEKAIQEEDYMEAARIRDEMKKTHENA
jgi:hypothetical protein